MSSTWDANGLTCGDFIHGDDNPALKILLRCDPRIGQPLAIEQVEQFDWSHAGGASKTPSKPVRSNSLPSSSGRSDAWLNGRTTSR
jgi:hypothetical protein